MSSYWPFRRWIAYSYSSISAFLCLSMNIYFPYSKWCLDYVKSEAVVLHYVYLSATHFLGFWKRNNEQENLHVNILKPLIINTVLKLCDRCKLPDCLSLYCYPFWRVESDVYWMLTSVPYMPEADIRPVTEEMLITLSSSPRVIPRGKK